MSRQSHSASYYKSTVVVIREQDARRTRSKVVVCSSTEDEHFEDIRRLLRKIMNSQITSDGKRSGVSCDLDESQFGEFVATTNSRGSGYDKNHGIDACLTLIDRIIAGEEDTDIRSATQNQENNDEGNDTMPIPKAPPGMTAPFPPHATRPGNPYERRCCSTSVYGCCLDGKDGNPYCCHWKVRCNTCMCDYRILHEQAVVDESQMDEMEASTPRRNKKPAAKLTSREALDKINKLVSDGKLDEALAVEARCKDPLSGAWYPKIKNGPQTTFKKLRKRLTEVRNMIAAKKNKAKEVDDDSFSSKILANFELSGSTGGTTANITAMSFSAEDILAVTFGGKTLFWNFASEAGSPSSSKRKQSAKLFLDHFMDVSASEWSLQEPRIFAVGSSWSIVVYRIDMTTGTQSILFRKDKAFDNGFDAPQWYVAADVCSVVFNPVRPELLAASCKEDDLIRIYDWKANRLVWSFGTRLFRPENANAAIVAATAEARRHSSLTFDQSGEHLFYAAPAGMEVKVFRIPTHARDTELVISVVVGQPISALSLSPHNYLSVVTSSIFNRFHLFRFFPEHPAEQMLAQGPVQDIGSDAVDQIVSLPASDHCMVYTSVTKANLLELDFPAIDQGYIKSTEELVAVPVRPELSGDYIQRGAVAASPSLAGVYAVALQGTVSVCQLGPQHIGMAPWNVACPLLAMITKTQEGSPFQNLADNASDFLLSEMLSMAYPNSAWHDLIATARDTVVLDQKRKDAITEKRMARTKEIVERRKRNKAFEQRTKEERKRKHEERMNRNHEKYWGKVGEIYIPETKKKTKQKNSAETVKSEEAKITETVQQETPKTEKLSNASEGPTLSFSIKFDETDLRWVHCKSRLREREISTEQFREALDCGLVFPDHGHTDSGSKLHRWKFYNEESGVTVITDHWVERPVTSWVADSAPVKKACGDHESVCCKYASGRCYLCEQNCR